MNSATDLFKAAALSFCFLTTASAAVANDLSMQLFKLIKEVESKLTLPPGAQRLKSYSRYYEFPERGKGGRIIGLYVLSDGVGRVEIVEPGDLPRVFDGGCDVITVVFTEERIVSLACNGKG